MDSGNSRPDFLGRAAELFASPQALDLKQSMQICAQEPDVFIKFVIRVTI